jgi:hypothetical protein
MALRLEDHVFRVLENQFRLYQFLGKHDWSFNMDDGRLTFTNSETKDLLARCPVQILGTESKESNTWLWAWANTASQIPDRLLAGSRMVKLEAEKAELVEYRTPELPISYPWLAAELSIVSAGHLGLYTYYAAGYDGGAMYCAVERCPEADDTMPRDGLLVNRVIFTAISALDMNHRDAIFAYLGQPAEPEGTGGIWDLGKDQVKINFDDQGRVTKLEQVLRPG